MKRVLPALALLAAAFTFTGCKSDPYESAVKMMEQLADISDKNKDDCDKMGAELGKFFDANKAKMEELKKLGEKKDEKADKAAEEKYKGRMEAAMGKMMPAQMKCMTNEKVQEAMKKMQ